MDGRRSNPQRGRLVGASLLHGSNGSGAGLGMVDVWSGWLVGSTRQHGFLDVRGSLVDSGVTSVFGFICNPMSRVGARVIVGIEAEHRRQHQRKDQLPTL